MAESHRHEIIEQLLAWYVDVLHGVRDGVGDDPIHLPLMSGVQLARLPRARAAAPAVRGSRTEPVLERRRALLAGTHPPRAALPPLHALRTVHAVELERPRSGAQARFQEHHARPAIVPLLDERVVPERIERGIAWLASNWQGVEPMLPRELVRA